jgi:hypothetical protein
MAQYGGILHFTWMNTIANNTPFSFSNQGLTNPSKWTEWDKYQHNPRRSKRLAKKHGGRNGINKPNYSCLIQSREGFLLQANSSCNYIHFQDKFWKLSMAGYTVENQEVHFKADPNTSSSIHARRERKRELYAQANKRLTREVLEQINNNKQAQTSTVK